MTKSSKKLVAGSAVILFVFALINKGLGFVKSMAIAFIYGANIQTDAYYVAEGLMQNALIPISEAIAVSFLPIYIGIKEKNKQDAKVFASRTLTDTFMLAVVLSGVLYVTAPFILRLMLPSYTDSSIELAIGYFRILIWGMCFYVSNQLLQSLLNAEKKYGFSSFTAMINNLILTVIVCFLGSRYGMKALAAAVLFSYIMQYLFLQIRSRKFGCLTYKYGFRDIRIAKLCFQAFPIFFGNAICELNSLVDRSLLSGMDAGAVTAVSYAAVLYQFASSLISIPMTTIIYTELAESFSSGHMEEGGTKLEKGIHISLFFCIPISLFVALSAELIVQITYGRGAFDAIAITMTAQGLKYYALCFLAYCLNALLFRACYSLGDTALPMKIGLVTVSLNIFLSIVLSRFLGLRGIVLATAIANTLTSIVTLVIFNRIKLKIHLKKFIRPGLRIIFTSVLSTVVCAVWINLCLIKNNIVLFIFSACLEFGLYAGIMILQKDEMGLEMWFFIKSLIRKSD